MSSVALFIQLVFLYCSLSCCLVFSGFHFFLSRIRFISFPKKKRKKKEERREEERRKRKRGGMSYPTDWLIAISISWCLARGAQRLMRHSIPWPGLRKTWPGESKSVLVDNDICADKSSQGKHYIGAVSSELNSQSAYFAYVSSLVSLYCLKSSFHRDWLGFGTYVTVAQRSGYSYGACTSFS